MFDVTIIGSGPGGYVAAIRCAQLGLKTALIEKYATLGGTCLNVGCIPSKALLDSSEHYHNATHTFAEHGIDIVGAVAVNLPQMIARKNKVVSDTCKGVEFLMKKNKITVYTGVGSFVTNSQLKVTKADGTTELLDTKNTVIATGSKPIVPAAFNYDKKRIITSTEALNLPEVPKRMTIIGAGVIGLELGSVYARLGTKIEVVEFADSMLPTMDADITKELQKTLKRVGFDFHFKHKVKAVTSSGNAAVLVAENMADGSELTIEADYCLVAIGRHAYTDGLGVANIGLTLDERGRIAVDAHLQTNVAGVYAIGDVVQGAMLAHKAEEEGVFVAELLAGQKPHIDYNLVPGVVYTWPELASVGKTEAELKAAGRAIKVGKFPFKALGRARASMDTDGLVKVIADAETDEVLGVHMCGPRVADVIMEAVVAMEFRASAEDIARICHGHPTFTEALKEAALDATAKRAIHI